jgi:hypothetical protein
MLPDGSSERITRAKDAPGRRSQMALLESTMKQPDATDSPGVTAGKRKKRKKG